MVSQSDSNICYWDLPWTNHLVAMGEPTDGSIPDINKPGFICDRRMKEYSPQRFLKTNYIKIKRKNSFYSLTSGVDLSQYFRFEKIFDCHIHYFRFTICYDNILFLGSDSYDSKWRFFSSTNLLEFFHHFWRNCEHISLLRLIGPDLSRTHRMIIDWYGTQIEYCPNSTTMSKLWEGIPNPSGSYVMDRNNGIIFSETCTCRDDFLATSLHLRVFSLYRGEIESHISRSEIL